MKLTDFTPNFPPHPSFSGKLYECLEASLLGVFQLQQEG